ncbi:MAG: hypothetical protein JXA89_23060 [Anaerolineae bacterium]|nr:hypothetical protein [Anaerolineae bacterium]
MSEEQALMTQIILLNGGPRKNGNTMQIAQWVAQGARDAGGRWRSST